MVDIAREIFAASGFDVEYRNYGWARSLSLARENRIDGVIGALKGDAPDFVFPERPMGTAVSACTRTRRANGNTGDWTRLTEKPCW